MWAYSQSLGQMSVRSGTIYDGCYSGQPPHTNVPADEHLEGLGPIPRGNWTMTAHEFSPRLGPDVIVLEPDADTRARIMAMPRDPDSFRIHGEREEPPHGFASDGCIVASRTLRMLLWQSTDHLLVVTD